MADVPTIPGDVKLKQQGLMPKNRPLAEVLEELTDGEFRAMCCAVQEGRAHHDFYELREAYGLPHPLQDSDPGQVIRNLLKTHEEGMVLSRIKYVFRCGMAAIHSTTGNVWIARPRTDDSPHEWDGLEYKGHDEGYWIKPETMRILSRNLLSWSDLAESMDTTNNTNLDK